MRPKVILAAKITPDIPTFFPIADVGFHPFERNRREPSRAAHVERPSIGFEKVLRRDMSLSLTRASRNLSHRLRVAAAPTPARKTLSILSPLIPLIGLVASAALPALAENVTEPDTSQRVFDITRDGTKIGTDIVDIETQGKITTVNITNHISVVVMFLVAYHMDSKATETWNSGHFVSYEASTDDNGTKRSLSAEVVNHKLVMTIDGKSATLPNVVLPATLWNKAFVSASELFDPGKGTILSIKVEDLGDETIEIHDTAVHAHHYKITGDLPRDIWFQGDVPVRVTLFGSDRSKIVSDIRQLPAE